MMAPLPQRRRTRRERHPLVYLAALSLVFAIVALFARLGMFYVAAGALAAVVMAVGAVVILLRAR